MGDEREEGMNPPAPVILLFGMPRSGTTWIGKIFDSHPDTLYRHEPDSYIPIGELPLLVSGEGGAYCEGIGRYVAELFHCRTPVVTTKRPLFRKSYLPLHRDLLYRASVYLSIGVGRVRRTVQLPTFDPLVGRAEEGITLVWKSIESLGRLGVISGCLDACHGVHIIRHPCGYVSSILKGEEQARFFNRIRASEGYRVFEKLLATETGRIYGLTLERLKALTPLQRLAWRWVLFNEHALRETASHENCMTLRYEDLCLDPEGVTRRMFQFCGLQWNPQTEAFLRASTHRERGSYYGVVRDPRRAAFQWRERLSAEQIEQVRSVVEGSRLGALYQDMEGE